MQVICGIGPHVKAFRHAVVAIGVFDAIHRGHQKVIGRAVAEAKRLKRKSVVITFYPHPVAVLHPKKFRSYVLTLEHRLKLIEGLGADACCVVDFTKDFAAMSAQDFIQKILVERFAVKKIVVGEDFCFGHDRSGNFDLLKGEGLLKGFDVEKVPTLKLNKINIKTKLIKEFIKDGKLAQLEKFLARPYSLLGEVERGDARGRRLGYPTANLKKENVIILPSGIYCVRIFLNGKKKNGLFYIGTRPSFKKSRNDISLECYVFDHAGNLYGQKILVEFLKKIRDDRKFSDEKSLVRQITRDVLAARKFFSAKS